MLFLVGMIKNLAFAIQLWMQRIAHYCCEICVVRKVDARKCIYPFGGIVGKSASAMPILVEFCHGLNWSSIQRRKRTVKNCSKNNLLNAVIISQLHTLSPPPHGLCKLFMKWLSPFIYKPNEWIFATSKSHSRKFVSCLSSRNIKMGVKWLDKIRASWAEKTPKQKFERIYKISNYMLRAIGIRVFTDDTQYWWTYSGYVAILSYFSITVYTIVYHITHNQFLKGFNAVCLSGVLVSASILFSYPSKKLCYSLRFISFSYYAAVYGIYDCFI